MAAVATLRRRRVGADAAAGKGSGRNAEIRQAALIEHQSKPNQTAKGTNFCSAIPKTAIGATASAAAAGRANCKAKA